MLEGSPHGVDGFTSTQGLTELADAHRPAGKESLVRGMGLLGAVSANMLNMIGVGPFITIPLIISTMGGPQAMLGWFLGALIAMCDGLVWAELGAAMPGSGGSYRYLLEAYGCNGLGRLMSFLFLWQTVFIAPLSAASGAVGFADYAAFLIPSVTPLQVKMLAASACLLATVLLYRNIRDVGRLSVALWVVVIATLTGVVVAGLTHFHAKLAFDFPSGAFHPSKQFFAGLGGATLIAMYDYGGYFNVCLFGGEVKNPTRTIPRSIILSIVVVGALYLALSISVIGVVPYREAMHSTAIISDFIQRIYGVGVARGVTLLIMWTAFSSIFAVLLGFTRVPYAAAVDGQFFAAFARVHPRKHFPSFSVATMGIAAALCCCLSLKELISAILVTQIVVQFVAQCVAVFLIRRCRKQIQLPFRMWLYPIPAVLALLGWIAILATSGWRYIVLGFSVFALGTAAYFWRAHRRRDWPFGVVA
jgi:amino acid transporter